MFDGAFKQQPQSEDLGVQTFFAHVRTGNWKSCQQVSNPHSSLFFYGQLEPCGPRGSNADAQAVPGGPVHLLERDRRNPSGSCIGIMLWRTHFDHQLGERAWYSPKHSHAALQAGSSTCHVMFNSLVHGRGSLPLASDHPSGAQTMGRSECFAGK